MKMIKKILLVIIFLIIGFFALATGNVAYWQYTDPEGFKIKSDQWEKERQQEKEQLEKERQQEKQDEIALRRGEYDIKFPLSDNSIDINDKRNDLLLKHLLNYKGKDDSGMTLGETVKNAFINKCDKSGSSYLEKKGVDFHEHIYQNDNDFEISIRGYTPLDEFADYYDDVTCVNNIIFEFLIIEKTGEIQRQFGSKNAKIVLDLLN